MVKLTKAAAAELLRRELGVSPGKIEKPTDRNGNPSFPYFEAQLGNLTATVHLTLDDRYKQLIELRLSFRDGYGGMTRYFYADDEYENYLTACDYMNEAEAMAPLLERLYDNAGKTAGELAAQIERRARCLRRLA